MGSRVHPFVDGPAAARALAIGAPPRLAGLKPPGRGSDGEPEAAVIRRLRCREDGSLKDGHTRKLDRSEVGAGLFLVRYSAALVVVEGAGIGGEWRLDVPSCTLGRGPGVDITIPDESMSKVHAALEAGRDGFRIRDMGSTNGLKVNGHPVAAADLKHGDRIGVGEHTLQFVVEPRERVGTYDLSDDS